MSFQHLIQDRRDWLERRSGTTSAVVYVSQVLPQDDWRDSESYRSARNAWGSLPEVKREQFGNVFGRVEDLCNERANLRAKVRAYRLRADELHHGAHANAEHHDPEPIRTRATLAVQLEQTADYIETALVVRIEAEVEGILSAVVALASEAETKKSKK